MQHQNTDKSRWFADCENEPFQLSYGFSAGAAPTRTLLSVSQETTSVSAGTRLCRKNNRKPHGHIALRNVVFSNRQQSASADTRLCHKNIRKPHGRIAPRQNELSRQSRPAVKDHFAMIKKRCRGVPAAALQTILSVRGTAPYLCRKYVLSTYQTRP